LIDFNDKIFYDKNKKITFDEKELNDIDEIHNLKIEKKDSETSKEEMISIKIFEEEKQDSMIYGASITALVFIFIVGLGKLFLKC